MAQQFRGPGSSVCGVTPKQLSQLGQLRTLCQTGEAVRLRKAANVKRSELAAAIGIGYNRLQQWELGLRAPSGPEGLRYAQLLQRLAGQ